MCGQTIAVRCEGDKVPIGQNRKFYMSQEERGACLGEGEQSLEEQDHGLLECLQTRSIMAVKVGGSSIPSSASKESTSPSSPP